VEQRVRRQLGRGDGDFPDTVLIEAEPPGEGDDGSADAADRARLLDAQPLDILDARLVTAPT
jgi:hypothetical protein